MVFRKKYSISSGQNKDRNCPGSIVGISNDLKTPDAHHNHLEKPKEICEDFLEEEHVDNSCGVFGWRPKILQPFAKTLWTFVGFYGLSGLCVVGCGAIMRSQMVSIERHFRISSGRMGVLLAANDMGSVAVVLFISHFGKLSHIPRLLATLTLLSGVFVAALALVQAADPLTLPTSGSSSFGLELLSPSANSSQPAPSDPIQAMLANPLLLCIDPMLLMNLFLSGAFGEMGANSNMAPMLEKMGGANAMKAMMEGMLKPQGGNADAGSIGAPPDLAALMRLMGGTEGLSTNMSSTNADQAEMLKLFGALGGTPNGLNSSTPGANIDMATMMAMMNARLSNQTSPSSNTPSSGMTMQAILQMMKQSSNQNNSSSSSSNPAMDMQTMMAMIGRQPSGSSNPSPSEFDMSGLMEMLNTMVAQTKKSIHWGYYYMFTIMVIVGALTSPRIPLQVFYVETNVKDKHESGIKIGAMTTLMLAGMPISLLVGGAIGELPIDLGDTQMTWIDSRWIGAWWLGFVIFGGATVLFSIPVFFLPKRIRLTKEVKDIKTTIQRRRSQIEESLSVPFPDPPNRGKRLSNAGMHHGSTKHRLSNASEISKLGIKARTNHRPSNASELSKLSIKAQARIEEIKDFLKTTRRILTNPLIILILINTFAMILSAMGTMSYQFKFMQQMYEVPILDIAVYLGVGLMCTVLVGTFLGGIITSTLKLSTKGTFNVVFLGATASLACGVGFLFLGCDNHSVVGFHQDIGNISTAPSNCLCIDQAMLVVCGEDGKNYLSPCKAGCTVSDGLTFSKCSNIGVGGTATPGFCSNCDKFVPFVVLMILTAFLMMITMTPHLLLLARLVPLRDQPIVMSLSSVVLTVGMLVGPIIFGNIYDQTCVLWSPMMNGMCVIPDKKKLVNVFLMSDIIVKAGGFLALIIAAVLLCCKKGYMHDEPIADQTIVVTGFTTKTPDDITTRNTNQDVYVTGTIDSGVLESLASGNYKRFRKNSEGPTSYDMPKGGVIEAEYSNTPVWSIFDGKAALRSSRIMVPAAADTDNDELYKNCNDDMIEIISDAEEDDKHTSSASNIDGFDSLRSLDDAIESDEGSASTDKSTQEICIENHGFIPDCDCDSYSDADIDISHSESGKSTGDGQTTLSEEQLDDGGSFSGDDISFTMEVEGTLE